MPNRFWDYAPSHNRRLPSEVYVTVEQPCFFTVRVARDRTPFADPGLASIAVSCLLDQRVKSCCQVLAYCVMPNHVHVIVEPAAEGASSLVYVDRFKGWCSRLVRQAGWVGSLWQPRSYDHVVRKDEDVARIAEYILYNPVRKGLSRTSDAYPWCGIPERLELGAQ